MKKIICPICHKELIRLEPFSNGVYTFWCDNCDMDIVITNNNEVENEDYMSQLKLIYYNDGKHKSNSVTVSVRAFFNETPSNPISAADIVGTGSYFGSALDDFEEQLNDYIDALIKFKNDVVSTKRAYDEAVMVDCMGRPIEFTK